MKSPLDKLETRNPKLESNSKFEVRSQGRFVIRISNLIRHSNFEFRISRAAGFTLIEMITVLTIIIIVLAIAIPVWNALMGGTNLAAAQNQISAFLSNARTDAIYNRQTIGVFFFIDPKTQQTAMAEVQVQTLYQQFEYSGSGPGYMSLFQPGTWTPGTPPVYKASTTAVNGPINSIELVNNPDPNTPGNYIFYRDIVLLPKGVGVALNNNTYRYNNFTVTNQYSPGVWNPPPNNYPPLDRYLRLGAIMFNPDGTLANIPFGIPFYECFTKQQSTNNQYSENLLCQRIQTFNSISNSDIASNVIPPTSGSTPSVFPLWSSVGLVVYDHDAYLNQHAGPTTVMNNSTNPPAALTPFGDGSQFNDWDMNYVLFNAANPGGVYQSSAADKYLEESWIDQNGTAFLVSPNSGTLLKAK